MLITGVKFAFRTSAEGDGAAPWANHFEAIPSDVPFRPERITPLPKIHGLLNAVVNGAIRGDYAELDDAGRYRLRMSYDRSGRIDLGATHPVRMMQPHAGAGYGMHFPLRPGIEVLVGFVNGDPDRPVIVGTAPNPITSSPVEQSNQTQNVLRTGSNNEVVIEDLKGTERVRVHTPHQNTTLQLGAEEEPEDRALITTEANVSFAARESVNAATPRAVLLAESATEIVGRRAFVAAGSDAISKASENEMEKPTSFSVDDVTKDLKKLSIAPEQREAFLEEQALEEQNQDDDDSEAEEPADEDTAGLWSGLAGAVSELARTSLNELVRAAAHTADVGLDDSKGRSQGQPLAEPQEPAVISAAEQTAALIGRDTGFVFGDRVASLASFDTASVMGAKVAQLKSPGEVEIAAGDRLNVTTGGTLDVAAHLVRVVGGYYPEAEAPPLDSAVTVGVMSKNDIRVTSVEDCITLCAKKHLIGSAHTGDVRWVAAHTVFLAGGNIFGTAGEIKFKASECFIVKAVDNILLGTDADCLVVAAGDIGMNAAGVVIEAGTIRIIGDVTIVGNLKVTGKINGH